MKKVLLTSASLVLAASAASAETITVATVNNGHGWLGRILVNEGETG